MMVIEPDLRVGVVKEIDDSSGARKGCRQPGFPMIGVRDGASVLGHWPPKRRHQQRTARDTVEIIVESESINLSNA